MKITYTWDKELFEKASKVIYDYDMKHSPKRFLGWFFIALTQFGVVGALKQNVYGLLVISTVLVIYWYGFRWNMRKKILLNGFEKSSSKNQTFHINVSNDGINIKDTLINWSDIEQIILLQDGFLIHHENLIYIPKKGFENDNDIQVFISLAKENAKSFKKDT